MQVRKNASTKMYLQQEVIVLHMLGLIVGGIIILLLLGQLQLSGTSAGQV